MSKNLIGGALVIAFLCHATIISAQNKDAGRNQENALAANEPVTNRVNPNSTDKQAGSPQAIAESKRLYKEGVKYGRAGLYKQAMETFKKAVELNPNFADAQAGLGHAYMDLGRWDEAIQSLQQALNLNPKDEDAYSKLGEAYLMRQRELSSNHALADSKTAVTNTRAEASLSIANKDAEEKSEVAPSASELDLTRTYRIGPGDVLDVRLSDLSTPQSTLFTVSPSGFIEHPNFTEPIAVSGLTADEVSARLEADLKRRALNTNPKVLVGVRDYVSHAILVSGLVKEPGTKILRREAIPLYVVVADAQPLAEAGRVTVVQRDADKIINVDLQDAVQMNRLVHPGDVVTLQPNQSQFVYVGGEVKNAGERPYRRGLTLTQVILSAGGLTREAKEIQLARDNGGGFLSLMKYKLKEINNGKVPDPPVQPGDRITVLH